MQLKMKFLKQSASKQRILNKLLRSPPSVTLALCIQIIILSFEISRLMIRHTCILTLLHVEQKCLLIQHADSVLKVIFFSHLLD